MGDGEASSAVIGGTVGFGLNLEVVSMEFGDTSTLGIKVELG